MLRTGTRHPDADDASSVASTSRPRAADVTPMDVQQLYTTLNEYLLLEHKFQPRLCLPTESENGEVTTEARDGAAHVLRCLKVWFDLPADVLIHAINLFDRFLTKMKVRPCHVPCITVSCMNIALDEYASQNNIVRNVSIEELVSISQSACTAGDVSRMSRVIVDKLSLGSGARCVTALHWLRVLAQLMRLSVDELPSACEESELTNLLEIVACDSTCVNVRTSELALVLIYHKLEEPLAEWARANDERAYYLYGFTRHFQAHCHMSETSLVSARGRVREVVARYEARSAQPQRQRLVWRLSERTLRLLRPTDRLTSLLPTIQEHHRPHERTRQDSSSSDGSATAHWPRSPVLPVYCGE